MQQRIKAHFLLTLAALSLPIAAGCGDGSSAAPATAQNEAVQASTSSIGDPSTMINDGAGTAPAQTVAIFLDSLRKGDEQAANGVLTTLARQELPKTTYQIQPLGSPAGQYKIGRVSFPYAEKTVALVECTWTEPPVEGNAQEVMDIVCEVHQEAEGWRISGIGVNVPGTDQALVLDFEDAASLQATIDSATGQAPPAGQPVSGAPTAGTQVATGQQAGLPAFPTSPTLPSGGAPATQGQPLPSYPQIALPPLDNAPINR